MNLVAKLGILLLIADRSSATFLDVSVSNIRNDNGHILVAVCPKAEFLSTHCQFVGLAPAHQGTIYVLIKAIPPGIYAIQAYHDENDNEKIDRNFFGLPTEGIGFSNNAGFHFGPPSFQDAAVSLGPDIKHIEIQLRYFTK